MTHSEQITFVEELSKNVTDEILMLIGKGKTPDNWDGIELRQLLADRFSAAVLKGTLKGKRKREYTNTCLIENL